MLTQVLHWRIQNNYRENMSVIFFQLAIVISLLVVFYVKRELLIWLCLFWSGWTLMMVHNTPLIIIQLGVIWGALFLLDKLSSQHKKINELESYLIDRPEQVKLLAHAVPESKKVVLQGAGHKKFLHQAISEAQVSLVILSGWITHYVVDKKFLNEFEDCLKRGVSVHIGYGWQNSKGAHERFDASEGAIAALVAFMRKYPDQLVIGEFANHEKILIRDRAYVVYGSNNWLSNSKFKNSERSIVVYDDELALCEQNRIIELVERNQITA